MKLQIVSILTVLLSCSDSFDLGRTVPVCVEVVCARARSLFQGRSWMRKMQALRLIIGFILMIPAIAFLLTVVFICFACSTYTMDRYTREIDNEVARRRIIARSRTLSTTLNTAASASTANATGLDDTKIMSCSELIVLDISESGRILPEQCEKYSCSICLEEYGAKEKVRQINLCQHRFHANCIDSWLQKNSTCPICRVSLLDEKL